MDSAKMKCCICGNEINGYGNNPEPVRDNGVCCMMCNYEMVIPARIKALQKAKKKK